MGREKNDWEKSVEFHGHTCPGLALGYKAAEAAKEKLRFKFSGDEEIVCVTENDACGVDAIQVVTGCTYGKGNLIYRDTGKMAFSFFNRKNGGSLRMVVKPFKEKMDRSEKIDYILNSPAEEILDFMEPGFIVPEEARLFLDATCESCGESAPENKIRLQDGKKVCLDCFREYSRGR